MESQTPELAYWTLLVPLKGHSDNKLRVFCKDGKNEVLSGLFLALATT